MALLELHDLRLRLGGHELLRGVELAVNEGEVHVLLGANGAGKSSLAYAVMGCEGYASLAGEILFAGERLNDLPLHERARRGLALAWQEPARFEGLTVDDFLHLGLAHRQTPANCIAAVGLDPDEYLPRLLDRTLSGGERKRVELAGVLALRPRLAILDEPTAGIDLLSLAGIIGVIEALRRQDAAVLLITHHEAAAAGADRASQLCGGRIVRAGTPEEVIAYYKTRRCGRCDGETCGHG